MDKPEDDYILKGKSGTYYCYEHIKDSGWHLGKVCGIEMAISFLKKQAGDSYARGLDKAADAFRTAALLLEQHTLIEAQRALENNKKNYSEVVKLSKGEQF